VGESGEIVSIDTKKHEFLFHKSLLGYPMISNPEGQKHALSISKHMRSYFPQPLIKEKSPTNKKTGEKEINNIFLQVVGRCHETYLVLSPENETGK